MEIGRDSDLQGSQSNYGPLQANIEAPESPREPIEVSIGGHAGFYEDYAAEEEEDFFNDSYDEEDSVFDEYSEDYTDCHGSDPSAVYSEHSTLEKVMLNENSLTGRHIHVRELKRLLDLEAENVLSWMYDVPPFVNFLLLNTYNWQSKRLIEDWEQDKDVVLSRIGWSFRKLNRLSRPGLSEETAEDWECPICCNSVKEMGTLRTYALGCHHAVCADCFRQHIRVNMIQSKRLYTTRCPGSHTCHVTVCRVDVEELLGKDELAKFKDNELHLWMDSLGPQYAKPCPYSDCAHVVLTHPKLRYTTLECLSWEEGATISRGLFCALCGIKRDHLGVPCELAKLWLEYVDQEYRSSSWLDSYTKACPQCGGRIVREEGCNHICCSNCNHEFCWVCMGPWMEHSGNSNYNCSRVRPPSKTSTSASRKKHNQVRLAQCEARYEIHVQPVYSERYASKDREELTEAISPVSRDERLDNARRRLSWTYVLLLFLSNSNQKTMLEDTVNAIESRLQRVSELRKSYAVVQDSASDRSFRLACQELGTRTERLVDQLRNTNWTIDHTVVDFVRQLVRPAEQRNLHISLN